MQIHGGRVYDREVHISYCNWRERQKMDEYNTIQKLGNRNKSQPRQGCDDPTRIHTLHKYVGQAEAVELATVRATQ